MAVTWGESRRGPRPSRIPFGDGEDAPVVAADLSPSWRSMLAEAPEGDFPPFGMLTKAKILDSALRRGFVERCGYHHAGQWQYRLTAYGAAVAVAVRTL